MALIFWVLRGVSNQFRAKKGRQGLDPQELDLLVAHLEAELLDAHLDGVPAGKPRGEVNVAVHAKVGGVDDLVGGRLVEDGLGVDAGLVGEGAEAGDGVVEGDVDLHRLGDHVLNLLELVQLVARGDVFVVLDDHAGEETAKGLRVLAGPGMLVRVGGAGLTVMPFLSPMPRTEVSMSVTN